MDQYFHFFLILKIELYVLIAGSFTVSEIAECHLHTDTKIFKKLAFSQYFKLYKSV